MKSLKEEFLLEVKEKIKRKYMGTQRARTATGQRANPIDTEPTLSGVKIKRK